MRTAAADFAEALRERRSRHDNLPLPYATSWCAKRCGWTTNGQPDKARASRAINALVRAGVIEYAGMLQARGKPNGTKTYTEPNGGAS
jgi:hypothetical protein